MVSQIELVRMTGIQRGALSWAAHFISAVDTSGPQTAQKNSCRSNHGVRYCTSTGLNGSFRSHQISESNNQHVGSCPEFNTRG